jgi:cytochrome b561
MRLRDGPEGWGLVTRLLHWTMAGLILFQLVFGLYMSEAVPDLLRRFMLTQTHKSWGFVVFVLAVVRVAWRLASPGRPALPPMPGWQRRAAAASHLMLYVLMFVLPVSGWVMVSAAPTQDLLQMQNFVFGSFALPDPWVPGVERIEDAARVVHVAAALGLAALLVVHAGAAIKHQFVDRDGVLARMVRG